MKYLILIRSNPEWSAAWASMTPEQQAEGYVAYQSLSEELRESGEFVDAEQLSGPDTVRTVTAGEHGPVASDAPLEIAGRLPEAQWGGVSLHPILAEDAPADASVA